MNADDRPRTATARMTNGEMLALAASLLNVDTGDIAAVAIVIGTQDGSVGLLGSEHISTNIGMVLLLGAAIERAAIQAAADSELL